MLSKCEKTKKGGNNKQTYLSKLSKATRKFDKIYNLKKKNTVKYNLK